jgi:uncharacterized protein (DUF2147 family)
MLIRQKCPGPLKNRSFVGLPFIWDFPADPDKPRAYHNSKILDPISGKTYTGKARLDASGKRLTLRDYIGISAIGRSVTWIKYSFQNIFFKARGAGTCDWL